MLSVPGFRNTGETFHSFGQPAYVPGNPTEITLRSSVDPAPIRHVLMHIGYLRCPLTPVEVSFRKFQELMQVKTCNNRASYYGVQRRQEKVFP